jgi:hypothetical protein
MTQSLRIGTQDIELQGDTDTTPELEENQPCPIDQYWIESVSDNKRQQIRRSISPLQFHSATMQTQPPSTSHHAHDITYGRTSCSSHHTRYATNV